MPQDQARVFNRYIELMNQANQVLGKVSGVLAMQAQMLCVREAWLVNITLWIVEEFNGIDPLRPYFREKLDSTRQSLLDVREHLTFLDMEVELR